MSWICQWWKHVNHDSMMCTKPTKTGTPEGNCKTEPVFVFSETMHKSVNVVFNAPFKAAMSHSLKGHGVLLSNKIENYYFPHALTKEQK